MILVLLAVLLTLSAIFSGSETAFFSIDRVARARLRQERSLTGRRILSLLERPRDLLVAILFGNVLINVSYFSVSNTLALRMRESIPWLEPVVHMASLSAIIIAGEIAPKTLTLASPVVMARIVAPVLLFWQRLSRFITEPLGWLTGKSLALVDRRWPPPGPMTDVELAQVVALQGREGLLKSSLSNLIEDVLLLSRVRVREIMTPRVDIVCFDISEGREAFMAFVATRRFSKILVHRSDGLDGIYGVLNLKEVLGDEEKPLEELVEKAWFIPETKSVESLLQEMLVRDATLAVVVDEYGGTAGLVTMEDVIEEVVGDISLQAEIPPIESREPGVFTVSGALSLRETNDLLDLHIEEEGATTVAGWLARKLGRIPREGDVVEFEEGWLTVTRVEKFRTRQVDLRLKKTRMLESHG